MKKLIVVGIIILLVGMSVPSTGIDIQKSSVSFDGKTLYVGGSGSGNYTKIQDAIDDAEDGDTVFVYNDSSPYYENIIVNKSINLIGENKNITLIDGNGKDNVIYVSANNTIISGFTIQNSGNGSFFNAGIVIHSSYNILKNNIISNNKECGVYFNMGESHGNNYIFNNVISNNRDFGIIIESIYCHLYKNENYVYHNYIVSNGCGIYIGPEYFPSVITAACYIYNNTILQNEYGIVIDQGFRIQVFNNTILNNNNGLSLLGEWWGCFNNSVYRNEISDNKNGIKIVGGFEGGANSNNIYLNNITGNKKGIHIVGTDELPTKNNISNNNLIDNKINAYFRWDFQMSPKLIWNYNLSQLYYLFHHISLQVTASHNAIYPSQ